MIGHQHACLSVLLNFECISIVPAKWYDQKQVLDLVNARSKSILSNAEVFFTLHDLGAHFREHSFSLVRRVTACRESKLEFQYHNWIS